MEIFVKISHHPNYEISNYGNVRNFETGRLLKPTTHQRKGRNNPTIYLRIELKKPRKKYLIHRLVAEKFIPNPNNHAQINHKDENGLNNCTDNLEWCNNVYNCAYSQGRPVNQLSPAGTFINTFGSISQAGRNTDSDYRLIHAVCNNKRKTHNNYKWQYA